ncbi:MAG: Pr6Pr family membrane protein [Actinomycetota bacterium]|nr:Pr6Pr family membrane protein [Actinomycetota bacterium]
MGATAVDDTTPAPKSLACLCFGATAVVVVAGLIIQVPVAMNNEDGFFTTPLTRGLNVFTFFTVQSNIIVGLTTAMLALGVATHSTAFRVLRLIGVVGITLTFIVFHLALSQLQDLTGEAAVADFLLHTASPILCVAGWLLFGPRGLTSWRIVALTFVFLVAWGVSTLVRGEVVDWYPYPFMDPNENGYLRVAANLLLIGSAFVALAAGAHALDRRLR